MDTPVLPPAAELERLLGAVRDDPARAALLVDLDGTLAPIVPRPEDVRLPAPMRDALEALRPRLGLLGFVSGRALDDLERIVGMDGCAYAGNHGMEIRHPGRAPEPAPAAARHLPRVRAFARAWPEARLAPRGVWLENKGATLTFHYRTAPDPEAAAGFLTAEVEPAARRAGLRVRGGRMVVEVLPPVAVDKGTAVRALLTPGRLPAAVYVGDDRTDLDAWRALRELGAEGRLNVAACVAVTGPEVPAEVAAAADVRVAGVAGTLALLAWLAGAPHAGVGVTAPQG